MPYPEEVLILPQQSCSRVGSDLGVHAGFLHPGCGSFGAETDTRRILFSHFFQIFFVFDCD